MSGNYSEQTKKNQVVCPRVALSFEWENLKNESCQLLCCCQNNTYMRCKNNMYILYIKR